MNQAGSMFPQTAAAVARIKAVHDGHRPAELYTAAVRAYASELLPLILLPEWIQSKTWVGRLTGGSYSSTLFDHHEMFRRRYSRGPVTWGDCAVVGQPYSLFGGDGAPTAFAIEAAEQMNQQGVAVWARPDLSAWYPGWTSLVVASASLKFRDAGSYGFQAIGNPCPEAPAVHTRRRSRWA